jgi:hypothetical protein
MKLPIDTNGLPLQCGTVPTPVLDYDTREHKADENGEPLYGLQLVAFSEYGPQVLKVTVPGEPKGLGMGVPVKVRGLVANYWQMGERSGVSFRAEKVEPETNPNGSAPAGASGSSKSAQAAG